MTDRDRLLAPLLASCLLWPALPAAAAAAPQPAERQIHREVVVLGAQPGQRRVVLEHLARRTHLGVHLLDLTPELRRHFGAPEGGGVLVSRVAPDSPAADAGVAVGDLIVSADGAPLRSASQLVGRVGLREAGDEIVLDLVRDKSPLTLRVTLEQSERQQVEIGQFLWHGEDDGPVVLGLGGEGLSGLTVDPEAFEGVIAIDPETINESVSRLLARLEARGETSGGLRLDGEQRRRLEQRIAELEERLRELERQLQRRRSGEPRQRD